jgi:hypothetical protein
VKLADPEKLVRIAERDIDTAIEAVRNLKKEIRFNHKPNRRPRALRELRTMSNKIEGILYVIVAILVLVGGVTIATLAYLYP